MSILAITQRWQFHYALSAKRSNKLFNSGVIIIFSENMDLYVVTNEGNPETSSAKQIKDVLIQITLLNKKTF